MSDPKPNSQNGDDLAQAALRGYMTTVIAATDCMAEVCPEIGVSFKRRWARAPQRIGFEPSAAAIEESCHSFEKDLRAFANYASPYFQPAVPLVSQIAERGVAVVDSVLESIGTHSVMLDTLAESIAATADLEAPPSVRGALEHQAAGLLKCADKVENELLPLVAELRKLFGQCEDLVARSREVLLADVETGLLNRTGFRHEVARRVADGTLGCMVRLRVAATLKNGEECTTDQFEEVVSSLSGAVFEQFRAKESIGFVGRNFLVLFGGTVGQVLGRQELIERRLSGIYPVDGVRVTVAVSLEVSEPGGAEWTREWLETPVGV